ncbi:MAG: methyltransferase RsmF C-terminal domain-like protein [Imperialibacter sp.]|uniref:methyltransferase RsmF C-terminal domain-like protein n=1 Tax=Imperialibacter sp. TaxID=2038411 RepID=UPI003A872A2A
MKTNFPASFSNRLQAQMGAEASLLLEALATDSPTSIRINTAKFQAPVQLEKVPWSTNGYYLQERPSFTLDPLMHAGAYYVQEASSMFLEEVVKQSVDLSQPLRVLDLCAAPGGKSTLLASLLSKESLLVSNEVIKSRAEILAENMTKWGAPNVVVSNNDPRDFDRLQGFFDLIVVDAPCSGEGLFRKDPNAINEWSPDNANLCSDRQRRILMDVWPALKPGGVLIYSTCTYNPAENEQNIQWLSEQTELEPVSLSVDASLNIREVQAANHVVGYQFMPHLVKGEGFFVCAVRKLDGDEWQAPRKDKFPLASTDKKEQAEVAPWLTDERDYFQYYENILAMPQGDNTAWGAVIRELRIVQAGVLVAEIKKKNLVPAAVLALSTIFKKDIFPTWELDLRQALQYLRKEEWPIDREKDGWHLMCYQQLPLGWTKRIATRFNNYYPLHWRIRMELPGELAGSILETNA